MVLCGLIGAIGLWDAFAWFRGDETAKFVAIAQFGAVGVGLLIGGILLRVTRGCDYYLGRREALLRVGVTWLVGAAVAALPYFLWALLSPRAPETHPFHTFADCYFEAMSGLTTTGASVLGTAPSDIESLPAGLLLWRATTHWIGGLGIVVLFVAVLPTLGVGGKKMFQFETTGPTKAGVRPRIRETARILWLIYFGMTLLEILLLKFAGMGWFDAVCHTFATLATGGFSTKNASVAAYDSVGIEVIIIIFMVLAGVNFGLYYQLIRGRVSAVFKDTEFRVYLSIIAVASVILILFLMHEPIIDATGMQTQASFGQAVRHGVFNAISIQTTTGFATADFDQWPFFPKAVLITLMFIGASAGSTGGGIKVIRIWIMIKVLLAEVERMFRPNVVRPLRVGHTVIDHDLKLATLAYIMGILVLFLIGSMLIMALEVNNEALTRIGKPITFGTAATASIATLNNIGPGLELVGPVQNYGFFTSASKIVMSILMALGRIEVYAIFALFVPRFWRRE